MKARRTAVLSAMLALGLAGVLCKAPPAYAQQAEGNQSDGEKVVKILRTSNKAQINRYVGRVYDFENVNPGQINNYFHSALFTEEGAAYTFVGPDGESGKIMVICPEHQLAYFDQLAADLDRAKLTSAPGSTYVYRQLEHRNAADPDFITIARQYASANSLVLGDVETNAIFIFDAPSGANYLSGALDAFLDNPTPVVKTKVKMYEVSLNNDGTLGLDYEDFKNGPYQNMLVGTASHSRLEARNRINQSGGPNSRANLGQTSRGAFGMIDVQYPSAYFDFLVEKGKAKVVTETQLVSSSSEPALFFTGEQVLYYAKQANPETFDRTVSGEAAPRTLPAEVPVNRHNASGVVVQALDTGVRLELVPIVGSEAIQLDLDAAVVSLLGFAENGSPMLNTRRAATTVTVKNGEEVVLGGLVRERQASTTYRMPILGKLPVIGWLFGGETEVLQKSMVVMVVEPTIDTMFANVELSDARIIAETTGAEEVSIPDAAYGFDMYLLDHEGGR